MKKIFFLLLAAATVVFAACSSDEGTSGPDKLEIVLTPGWDATRGMTSSSQTAHVAVSLNAETVRWKVSSDSDWCVVDEETVHTGSGEFTIEVTANDDFKTRNAVVTLAAGAYTCRMEVDQSGNIFILDRIYSVVAPGDTEAFDVEVKTLSTWQPVDSEWIHAEVVETSEPDGQGMTTSTLRIRCDANTSAEGRYGELTLEPTDGVGYSTSYAVYQFGTGLSFDEENRLDLAARGEVEFDVQAPSEAIVGVTCPTWVTYTPGTDDGETVTYTFSVGENPSDTKTEREATIELSIRDVSAKTELPVIRQAFYPAGGIVSGAGLKMFAETFNAGGDVSDWTSGEDGKTVQILGDVDMADVEWTPVGTEDRPFDGIVAGNNHSILNWKAAQPLFGYTAEGSEIADLTIDGTSKLTAKAIAADEYVATLVGVCNGTLRNCSNMAAVTLDVAATVDGACGVGGLVGLVGATGRVESCSNGGLVSLGSGVVCNDLSIGGVVARTEAGAVLTGCVNEGAVASSGATPANKKYSLYTGGVVGYAGGPVENCSTEGDRSVALKITAAYMSYTGGIVGWADDAVTGCTNKQPVSITANCKGDACRYAYAGGIAGKTTGALSDSKNRGSLSAAAICKFVVIGGIVGSADGAVSNVVNVAAVSLPGNPGGADGPLKEGYIGPRYAYVGGIAGQLMEGSSITGNGDTTNSGAVSVDQMEHNAESYVYIGGIAGQHLGTSVSNTVNDGAVSVTAGPASGTSNWNIRSLGGIVGQIGDANVVDIINSGASVTGSKNHGAITHAKLARSDSKPTYLGGIVGFVFASDCSVSDCSNSGAINANYWNNQVDYGDKEASKRGNFAGGIIGAAVAAADAEVNVISSVTNTGTIISYRGAAGGVVGYVDGARITDCTNKGDFSTNSSDTRLGRAGGIVAAAVNAQIEGCVNQATVTVDDTASPITIGGVVGALLEGSAVRDCKHYGVLYSQVYGSKTIAGGGVAGTSVKGTTIDDCRFGGQFQGKSGDPVALTADDVCSDSNFTGSGNTLWDGK
ncbi:MAG: BACON domain-containing protein [Alistipes sp.]|nr:BACON domain-containing protein [Alistipes sp.]